MAEVIEHGELGEMGHSETLIIDEHDRMLPLFCRRLYFDPDKLCGSIEIVSSTFEPNWSFYPEGKWSIRIRQPNEFGYMCAADLINVKNVLLEETRPVAFLYTFEFESMIPWHYIGKQVMEIPLPDAT